MNDVNKEKELRKDLDSAFHAIEDLHGLAFTITDPREPDNPIIYASDSFLELTGYDEKDIIGRNCRFLQRRQGRFLSGTDQRAVMELRDAVREERSTNVVLLNFRKDGAPFYNCLSIFPIRDATCTGEVVSDRPGLVKYYLGIQSDVTNLMERENENDAIQCVVADEMQKAKWIVEEVHDRSKSIASGCRHTCAIDGSLPSSLLSGLTGIHACFVLSDPTLPDNPMVFCSPEFLKLTGYSAEELIGRNCRMLQGPDTEEAEKQKIKDALKASPPRAVTATLANYRKNGEMFMNRVHISPVRDSNGKVQFFVGVQYEVSVPSKERTSQAETVVGEVTSDLTGGTMDDELALISLRQKSIVGSVRVAARALSAQGLRRKLEDQIQIRGRVTNGNTPRRQNI